MIKRRRTMVAPDEGGSQWMTIDLQFEVPPGGRVILAKTDFGPIGMCMAKTISANDGGGQILNSSGQHKGVQAFRKAGAWADWSGPTTDKQTAGVALLDHPADTDHPVPFLSRDNGWTVACLTLDGPVTIALNKPVLLLYGLWNHPSVPDTQKYDEHWQTFASSKLASMTTMPGKE